MVLGRFKNMNPWVVRVGIGILVSGAAYLFTVWLNRNKTHNHSHVNLGNFDGSNIRNCCICLTEFVLLKKNEVITLPCRHKICRECCTKLFDFQVKNRRNCPECRQLISEEFISTHVYRKYY